MKKICVFLLSFLCIVTYSFINTSLCMAEEQKKINANIENNIIVLEDEDCFKSWLVRDENHIYYLAIDYNEMSLTIDNETYFFQKEKAISEQTRIDPTINYSSGINYSGTVPWKGSLTLLTTALSALLGAGNSVAGWASAIVSVLTADAENIYITFTQYSSNEQYYSSYYGYYYNKRINMNIRFYESSVSSSNLIYGPVNGNWFDPIRPN